MMDIKFWICTNDDNTDPLAVPYTDGDTEAYILSFTGYRRARLVSEDEARTIAPRSPCFRARPECPGLGATGDTYTTIPLPATWWHLVENPGPWLGGWAWSRDGSFRVDYAYNPKTGKTVSPVGWDCRGPYAQHIGNDGPRCVGRPSRPACCRPWW